MPSKQTNAKGQDAVCKEPQKCQANPEMVKTLIHKTIWWNQTKSEVGLLGDNCEASACFLCPTRIQEL